MMKQRKIKMICIDVDGTLTNGNYHISVSGDISKSFYTRDFWAMQRVAEEGILVYLVTGATDSCTIERASFVNIPIISGSSDKASDVQLIIDSEKISWDQVAFIGDAENDLEVMGKCGLTGCPSDAVEEILKDVNYLSDFKGGRGAVHDFIKYILEDVNNIDWIKS